MTYEHNLQIIKLNFNKQKFMTIIITNPMLKTITFIPRQCVNIEHGGQTISGRIITGCTPRHNEMIVMMNFRKLKEGNE